MSQEYIEFLKAKMRIGHSMGFEIDDMEMHPMLFPHQKDIVRWAIRGGRRAIFAAFGLGKSFMQLEQDLLDWQTGINTKDIFVQIERGQ